MTESKEKLEQLKKEYERGLNEYFSLRKEQKGRLAEVGLKNRRIDHKISNLTMYLKFMERAK